MEVIGKTTNGVIISATDREVAEILRAVAGKVPDKIEIGQKIPAIDYSTTITKVRQMRTSSEYTYMLSRIETFSEEVEKLKKAVESAANIDV